MFYRHIGMRHHHLVGRVSSMDKSVDINKAGKHVFPTFQRWRKDLNDDIKPDDECGPTHALKHCEPWDSVAPSVESARTTARSRIHIGSVGRIDANPHGRFLRPERM
jgi:hypothetical protein